MTENFLRLLWTVEIRKDESILPEQELTLGCRIIGLLLSLKRCAKTCIKINICECITVCTQARLCYLFVHLA